MDLKIFLQSAKRDGSFWQIPANGDGSFWHVSAGGDTPSIIGCSPLLGDVCAIFNAACLNEVKFRICKFI